MPNKEIISKDKKPLEITKDKILGYLDSFGFGTKLDDLEKKQFIEIATAFQLNPFKREIYCIPYFKNVKDSKGKWIKEKALSIITGYEVYLKRAERLHVLDGWSVKTEGSISNSSLRAIITIYRIDWKHPFIHEVYFKEYNQDNKIWKNKPVTMIKKVAIAQAFRMAFPDDMGGLPYTNDELPENMTTNITEDSETTEEIQQNKTKPSEETKRKMLLAQIKDVIKTDGFKNEKELKAIRKEVEKAKSNADLNSILVKYQSELNKSVNKEFEEAITDKAAKAFKGEILENFKDDIPGEATENELDIF